MANTNLVSTQKYTTVLISTTGDTIVVPKGFACRAKNLDATHSVALSDVSNPAGGVPAAGAQTTLQPAPTTGRPEAVYLFADKQYFLRADTAACLVAFELVPMEGVG